MGERTPMKPLPTDLLMELTACARAMCRLSGQAYDEISIAATLGAAAGLSAGMNALQPDEAKQACDLMRDSFARGYGIGLPAGQYQDRKGATT